MNTGTHDRVEFVGIPVGHHTQPDNFNLEQFEYQVTRPDSKRAARMLLLLLTQLDHHYGQWGPHFSAYSPGTPPEVYPLRERWPVLSRTLYVLILAALVLMTVTDLTGLMTVSPGAWDAGGSSCAWTWPVQ
ncbi:hypothetical protein BRR54_23340 [Salmonella enterica]|nr:hypothetical protein [Salmonella enterica]EBR1116503.1 hypothetical protein [Salmonella enterica]